jgi:hypothetical protein
MKTNPAVVRIGFAVILIVIIISIVVFLNERKKQKSLIYEAPAQIVEIYPRKEIDPTTGIETIRNILIKFQYSFEGATFEKQIIISQIEGNSFRVGQNAKVCINPNNSEEVKLYPENYKCGQWFYLKNTPKNKKIQKKTTNKIGRIIASRQPTLAHDS